MADLNQKRTSVVLIDDEIVAIKQLRRILEKEVDHVASFTNPRNALKYFENNDCTVVISDIRMPEMDGLELMQKVHRRFPDIEFIFITGFASLDGAIEATKEGAFHYLSKPFTPDQLRARLSEAVARVDAKIAARAAAVPQLPHQPPVIIGDSHKIRLVRTMVQQIAPTDCHVLITGESGTGKELVARSVHALSPRAEKPFLAFNCGALTETLISNELFGHEKGAYTGADSACPGLLEMATGGTLFLDEIGEMPLSMQVKLLRVLQEKELMRVGGRRPIPLDVRLVSATAKDLKEAVGCGAMRSDFYYRINVFNIHLPSLSERREDIVPLARHILGRLRHRTAKPIKEIAPKAMVLLSAYAFPGNVRELENILERAAAVCEGDTIRVSDLPPDLAEFELHKYQRPSEPSLTLAQSEQDYIGHVLKLTAGNRTQAAAMLGIDRVSLWRKIKKYRLE